MITLVLILAAAVFGSNGRTLSLSVSGPVLSGNEVNLTCSVTETLLFHMLWYRDSILIAEDANMVPGYESIYSASIVQSAVTYRLTIKACDYTRDSTTWWCQSILFTRGSIDLHVKVPVSIVTLDVSHANYAVVSGEDLTFTCTTDPIDPQATIAWYVDGASESGGPVVQGGPGLVATVGTLIYTTTNSDRNLQVHCTAENVGTVIQSTTSITMDVKIPVRSLTLSVLGQSGSMVTVNAGDELSFNCVTGDIYPAATIVWYVGGSEHAPGTGISDSNTDPTVTTGTLRYTTSSADNNGAVYCTAVNVGSMVISNTITMNVRYAPDVSVSVNEPVVNETTGTVKFTCYAHGIPNVYTFLSWKHYVHGILVREIPADVGSGVNMLTLNGLSYETTGHYVCSVVNGIENAEGELVQTNGVDITVLGAATFQSSSNIRTEIDKSVALTVKMYSSLPIDTWFWTSEENVIMGDNYNTTFSNAAVTLPFYGTGITLDGYEARLQIHKIGINDFTTYAVTVVNAIGGSSHSLSLSQAGPPETPMNFEELSVHPDNVTVSWRSGFDGGYTQEFHLSHKAGSSQEYSDDAVYLDNGHGTIKNVTIQNLNSGTAYTLRVRAVSVRPDDNVSGYAHITINTPTGTDPGKGVSANSNAGAIAGGIVGVVAVLGSIALIIYFDRRGLINCRQNKSGSSKSSSKSDGAIYENEVFTRAETEHQDANAYEELSEHEVRRSDAGYIHADIESVNGNTDNQQQINSTYSDLDQKTENEHEYSKLNLSRGRTTGLGDSGYIDVHQITPDDIQYSVNCDTPYINMNWRLTDA